jgi:hypothetical protein
MVEGGGGFGQKVQEILYVSEVEFDDADKTRKALVSFGKLLLSTGIWSLYAHSTDNWTQRGTDPMESRSPMMGRRSSLICESKSSALFGPWKETDDDPARGSQWS